MRKKRYPPFGYRIESGKVVLNAIEAAVVKDVFAHYASGKSYNEISNELSFGSVPYKVDSPQWNKHMVKRMLENKCYCGENGFPPIMTENSFKLVNSMLVEKAKVQKLSPILSQIREKLVCGQCGSGVMRERRNGKYDAWFCRMEGRVTEKRVTDKMILEGVISGLNRIIENPDIITLPVRNIVEPSLEITKLANRINREFEKTSIDEDVVKILIKQLATARYDSCSDMEPERITENLKKLLKTEESKGEYNSHLFNMAIKEIRLNKDGSMDFILMSGKVLIGINR